MSLCAALLDFVENDDEDVRERLYALIEAGHLDPHRLPRTADEAVPPSGPEAFTARGERLAERVRLLDAAPVGVTLTGPAYRDTPIRYANLTIREITGYSLSGLRGANPRLLQGPRTESEAVTDLAEAVAIWEAVTVEVWNHRRDGTPFRNRVSLRPLAGDDGTITHWVAVQEPVRSLNADGRPSDADGRPSDADGRPSDAGG